MVKLLPKFLKAGGGGLLAYKDTELWSQLYSNLHGKLKTELLFDMLGMKTWSQKGPVQNVSCLDSYCCHKLSLTWCFRTNTSLMTLFQWKWCQILPWDVASFEKAAVPRMHTGWLQTLCCTLYISFPHGPCMYWWLALLGVVELHNTSYTISK